MRLSKRAFLLLSAAAISAAAASRAKLKYPLAEKLKECRESFYSPILPKILAHWPPRGLPKPEEIHSVVWMQPVRTPDQPDYIGVIKRLYIEAPVKRVQGLIDGFEKYREIFSDIVQVKIEEKDGNKWTVYWERPAPLFFLPNTHYEQVYLIDERNSRRVFYRYQLKTGNQVNFSDGVIVLEKSGSGTLLTGYDFFDADWGIARTLAESEIWRQALTGSFRGDIAMKTKAEHPDWSLSQIEKEEDRILDQFPVNVARLQFLSHLEIPDAGASDSPSAKGSMK